MSFALATHCLILTFEISSVVYTHLLFFVCSFLMSVDVTIGYEVIARYHVARTPGSLNLFMPRDIAYQPSITTEIRTELKSEVVMKLPSSLPLDTPVMGWWYVERTIIGETVYNPRVDKPPIPGSEPFPQRYRTFSASARTTIDDIAITGGTRVELIDITGTVVGYLLLTILKVADSAIMLTPNANAYMTDDQINKITADYTTEIKIKLSKYDTNIDYLNDVIFTQIGQPIGKVPMWMFVNEMANLSNDTPSYNADTLKLFERLLVIALDSIGTSEWMITIVTTLTSIQRDRLHRELLARMILVFTRHMLYVKDSTAHSDGDKFTDEWNRVGHQPHPEMVGFDCEDGTALAYELCHRFRRFEFKSRSSLLFQIQQSHSMMVPMYCIGSIQIGKGHYTYHAFVMWLTYVHGTQKLSTVFDVNSSVIYESTTFGSSCWGFDDDVHRTGVRNKWSYYDRCLSKPIEGNVYCPADVITKEGVYRHLITGFLNYGYGARSTRIDFVHNKKRGVPISNIMNGDWKETECVYTFMSATDEKNAIEMYKCMPQLKPLRCGETKDVAVVILYGEYSKPGTMMRDLKGIPRYDICYRFIDWTPQLRERVILYTHAIWMDVITVNPTSDFYGIRVRIWDRIG